LLADDCAMDLCGGNKEIDSMNIIFDTINDLVYVMAAAGSYFEMKVVTLGGTMTKKKTIKLKP
jgi:hypothetical protein